MTKAKTVRVDAVVRILTAVRVDKGVMSACYCVVCVTARDVLAAVETEVRRLSARPTKRKGKR